MDYRLYLGVVTSRQDGATNLVYYLKYTRYLSSQQNKSKLFSIIKINIPKKERGKRVSDQVINYIIISIINSKAGSSIV
jgi:hypothetical protein